MSKSHTYFADTTIVYYRLDHSHSLLKQASREAASGGTTATSNFVRGEFIRGYITGLIELYFAIKEEHSVDDGIALFSSQMGNRHPRKVSNAFRSTTQWLVGIDDANSLSLTLRRLGEYIRLTLTRCDNEFVHRVRDPLECEIGVLTFRQESYDEEIILDFYEDYDKIRERPNCKQCEFRARQREELSLQGIDLHSAAQQAKYAEHEGYVHQAKRMEQSIRSKRTEPSCWYCDRLGDTIIALSAPAETTILTGDKASFPALTAILNKPLKLIPSLKELREARDQQEQ
jgi:hypothetical protein